VIKFARDDSEAKKKLLQREKRAWIDVWKRPARIQQLGGAHALVMPYVQPCPAEVKDDPVVIEAVKGGIRKLADHCLQHNDLKWEHVGLYMQKGETKAVLFDLAASESLDLLAKQVAVEKMLADLQLN